MPTIKDEVLSFTKYHYDLDCKNEDFDLTFEYNFDVYKGERGIELLFIIDFILFFHNKKLDIPIEKSKLSLSFADVDIHPEQIQRFDELFSMALVYKMTNENVIENQVKGLQFLLIRLAGDVCNQLRVEKKFCRENEIKLGDLTETDKELFNLNFLGN